MGNAVWDVTKVNRSVLSCYIPRYKAVVCVPTLSINTTEHDEVTYTCVIHDSAVVLFAQHIDSTKDDSCCAVPHIIHCFFEKCEELFVSVRVYTNDRTDASSAC